MAAALRVLLTIILFLLITVLTGMEPMDTDGYADARCAPLQNACGFIPLATRTAGDHIGVWYGKIVYRLSEDMVYSFQVE